MKHGFTTEQIQETLRTTQAFIEGRHRGPLISIYQPPVYRQLQDPERMVEEACRVICADGASGNPDILPRFLPDFGTCSTAAIWGGERIPGSEGICPHIHPTVKQVSELEKLTVVQSFEESDYQVAIDLYRRVCDRLETDQVFVATPDFQGPMNTLSLIMEQTELLCALYTDPDLVKHVLEQITTVLIEYVGRYIRTVGEDKVLGSIWPPILYPFQYGVSLTQDYMPLLGPEHYEEFEIPCLKRIADTFGGVFIHCCGEYERHLPALKRSGIRIYGMEQHYPCTKIWNQYEIFGDEIFYVPVMLKNHDFPKVEDFLESIGNRPCGNARFWFFAHGSTTDPEIASFQNAVKKMKIK